MGKLVKKSYDPLDLLGTKANKKNAEATAAGLKKIQADAAARNEATVTANSALNDTLKLQANDDEFLAKKKNNGQTAAALSNQLGIS